MHAARSDLIEYVGIADSRKFLSGFEIDVCLTGRALLLRCMPRTKIWKNLR
jgi:hypothetical protein